MGPTPFPSAARSAVGCYGSRLNISPTARSCQDVCICMYTHNICVYTYNQ